MIIVGELFVDGEKIDIGTILDPNTDFPKVGLYYFPCTGVGNFKYFNGSQWRTDLHLGRCTVIDSRPVHNFVYEIMHS